LERRQHQNKLKNNKQQIDDELYKKRMQKHEQTELHDVQAQMSQLEFKVQDQFN
jgi:hypothetical protein